MESLRQLDDAASRVRAELERREITGSDGRLIDHIVVAQRLSVARMSRRQAPHVYGLYHCCQS